MKNTLRILAIALLFILGISAIYGGWGLMRDPSGGFFLFPIELLHSTPFSSYFIPGLILFVTIGLMNLLAIILVLKAAKYYYWIISIQGLILFGWLSIELMLNFDFYHPVLHNPLYVMAILLMILGYVMKRIERTAR